MVPHANGTARLDLPIPDAPELYGQELFAQAAVVDPTANLRGMVLSNPARFVVGAR